MDLGLQGSKIIVTGGASHIGRAIVSALAAEGAAIAIIDIDAAQAERTAARALGLGAAATHVISADLTDLAAAGRACNDAMAKLDGVDNFISNAGSNRPDFFLKLDPAGWQRTLDLNLTAVMACTRAVLPHMIDHGGGGIVATASTAASGEQRQSVYAAAKAGVVAFIRTIALEYGRHGVRANCVAPGLTLPEGADDIGAQSLWNDRENIMNDAQTDYVVKATPLRRLSKADDIARSVVFLASPLAARQITGQLITVAGGFAMR
jgi:NAD(P)-dependent dehydrogenase (short-subunit alcohol dehydrogenase family)